MSTSVAVTVNSFAVDALTDFVNGKTFKMMLFTTAPASTDDNISDLTEIAPGFGYAAGGPSVTVTVNQETADAWLTADELTVTAAGGDIGPYIGISVYEVATGKLRGSWYEVAPKTIAAGTGNVFQFNQERGFAHVGDIVPS